MDNTTTKTTVVIGASPNPARYAHRAVASLQAHGHPVKAVGLRTGQIKDVSIHTELLPFGDVDTVSLYVGPRHLGHWREYIVSLRPRRVIFNPGTEHPAFERELENMGIQAQRACTLVMLSVGNY